MGLFLTGNTINLMTLGGLALAIGLLVDNATVTIENIHRNQSLGKPLTVAIIDGAAEVIQPLTVATLAICIVFFPVVLLFGVARDLFIPLAVTVVFCMLASYVLSFTLVPTFARLLLPAGDVHHGPPRGFFGLFERGFARVRDGYGRALVGALNRRALVLICGAALLLITGALATRIGLDFFPAADVGLIKLHYRAPRAPASSSPKSLCSRWRIASARSFRRTNSTPSTTISASPRRSTWPSCPATMSATWTPRSPSR